MSWNWEEKLDTLEMILHTDVNDITLKYIQNYKGDITLLKLKGSKRKKYSLNIT